MLITNAPRNIIYTFADTSSPLPHLHRRILIPATSVKHRRVDLIYFQRFRSVPTRRVAVKHRRRNRFFTRGGRDGFYVPNFPTDTGAKGRDGIFS